MALPDVRFLVIPAGIPTAFSNDPAVMSISLKLYEQLLEATDDKARARVLAWNSQLV